MLKNILAGTVLTATLFTGYAFGTSSQPHHSPMQQQLLKAETGLQRKCNNEGRTLILYVEGGEVLGSCYGPGK